MATTQVNGVQLAKVKRQVLNMSVREIIGVDPKGKKEPELIKLLVEHFAKDPAKNVACDQCGGCSDPDTTSACPFCGDEDGDTPDEDMSLSPDGTKISATGIVVQGKQPAKAAPPVATPTVSSKDLVAWEERYSAARAQTTEDWWQLGRLLKECQDSNLWRLATTVKGEQTYANFYAYMKEVHDLQQSTVKKMLRFNVEFDLDLAKKYSRVLMSKMLNMPEQARSEFLLAAKEEDLSEEQLSERVEIKRKVEEKAKHVPPSKQPQASREKLITLVSKPAKQRVKLMTYGDQDKRAKRIGDHPMGILKLERGQVVFEIVPDTSGNLELVFKALPRHD